MLGRFSHVWLFSTLWIVARQAPLSMRILQVRILESMTYSPWHQKELDMTEQLSLSNHHNYLWAMSYNYFLHFIEEKTETQKTEVTVWPKVTQLMRIQVSGMLDPNLGQSGSRVLCSHWDAILNQNTDLSSSGSSTFCYPTALPGGCTSPALATAALGFLSWG